MEIRTLDPDTKGKPLSFPNGGLKKHHHHHQRQPPLPPPPPDLLYRECLKNHAASLGGHALDGCGEFMPSPASDPTDPTSLTCAACGCHRNFHRRLHGSQDDEDDEDHVMDGQDEEENHHQNHHRSSNSPPPYSSAPHMLLALSAGLAGGPTPGTNSGRPITPTAATAMAGAAGTAAVVPRKRFRSRFSAEQKERMQELSERLGWRMQKRDEGLVEKCCKEIGVDKGVFKVWMHNNKHTFFGSRRGETDSTAAGGSGGGGGGGGVGGENEGNGNSHVVNASSSSS